MADVTLILKADNSDYIRKTQQAQKATEKLYTSASEGSKKQLGLIEKEIQRQKQLTEQRNRATSDGSLATYNKLLDDSKKRLADLEKQGLQTTQKIQKSNEGLEKSVFKIAAAYLSWRTAIKLLEETLFAFYTKSQEGMDLLEQKVNGFKASLGVLQGEFIKLGKNMADFARDQDKGSEKTGVFSKAIEFFGKVNARIFPKAANYITDLYNRVNDAGMAAQNLTKIEQELEAEEIKMIVARAKSSLSIKQARAAYAEGNGTMQERIDLLIKAIELENKTADEEIEHQKKVVDMLIKRNEERRKIGNLSREDERELAEAQAKEINLRTESLGREFRMLTTIREARAKLLEQAKLSYKGLPGVDQFSDQDLEDIMKTLEDLDKKLKKSADDSMKRAKDKADKENKAIKEGNDNRQKIEDDAAKAQWESLQKSIQLVENMMTQFIDWEVDAAQRRRELLDTQISELENELNAEVELYTAGYASNVGLKKKELEEKKRLRDQALKDEEEALKKQRVMESISQGINIFTSATQILKAFTKKPNPIGLVLGAAAITAMFALLASWRSKSAEATKLAAGGSGSDTGLITGRSHTRGGERFLSQVEVERGEAWGVLSIPATQRFGKVFHHMVSSFNKGEIPTIQGSKINNRVVVQNDGSNSRLDKVIDEQRKLNKKLSENDSLQDLGNRVVIKKGNTVRIIKR
jgi:hypothetical protein